MTKQHKKMLVGAALIVAGIFVWKKNQSKGVYTPILDRKA